ncbi:MAG TPA: hypothetical protein VEX65_02705 [Flavisolibacter sp.]|jgi:ethanolamine utilization microcompartment shell protein EutL|nr:hypothetical protein [Flavisolibacter sp.]
MYTEARKIHLLEAVLKVSDEATLTKLEAVLKKSASKPAARESKPSIYDFLGMLSKEEAAAMRKAIDETAEQIHPDDWK